MDPDAKLQPEKEGHEFGTYCFEELNETAEISPDFWTQLMDNVEHIEITHELCERSDIAFVNETDNTITEE